MPILLYNNPFFDDPIFENVFILNVSKFLIFFDKNKKLDIEKIQWNWQRVFNNSRYNLEELTWNIYAS